MPADYIPGKHAEFSAWLDNLVTYANANLAAIGLVADDMGAENARSSFLTPTAAAAFAACPPRPPTRA